MSAIYDRLLLHNFVKPISSSHLFSVFTSFSSSPFFNFPTKLLFEKCFCFWALHSLICSHNHLIFFLFSFHVFIFIPMKSSSSSTNPSQPSTFTVTSSLRSILPHPSQMDESSYENDPNPVDNTSISPSSSSTNRFSDHQLHLINRSNDNCPIEIDGSKRTKWLNAGKKAKQNFVVISSAPPFLWPTTHYDAPIFLSTLLTHSTPLSHHLFFEQSNHGLG